MSQPTGSGESAHGLADGNTIPMLGLGVWQVENEQECVDAVRWALETAYSHIVTAQAYGNEGSVGVGIRESGVPREEIFVTTKFFPRRRDPVVELEGSLGRLGLEFVDLYIVHWPAGGPTWAWPGMERARELGYARSIGGSNFAVGEIDDLLQQAEQPPVVNRCCSTRSPTAKSFSRNARPTTSCSRRTARLAPAGTWTTRQSRRSLTLTAGRRRRCSCVGESSTAFLRSRSPRTNRGSSRTRKCSTSSSAKKTCRLSTASTRRAEPIAHAKTSGGKGTKSAHHQSQAAPMISATFPSGFSRTP